MITRRTANIGLIATASVAAARSVAAAAEPETVKLSYPRSQGGKSILEALWARRSGREFAEKSVPIPVLSELLWAAFGVNRRNSGDRTAPSARHALETVIYVAMANGVWRYEPSDPQLVRHSPDDIRGATGTQDFVARAPINLIYVADGAKLGNAPREEKRLYAFADAGFIGQNVYLFCASEGLATVFRGSVDRDKLGRLLRLDASKFVTFVQTVGYPKE